MNSGLKKLLAVAGAFSATVPLLLAGAGEASAAQTPRQGVVTLCTDADFNGSCTTLSPGDSWLDPVRKGPGKTFQDSISSIWNFTDFDYCVFVDNNGGGASLRVPRGNGFADLSALPQFNDSISTVVPCGNNI
jgi:Peptidase inhibitor family I36